MYRLDVECFEPVFRFTRKAMQHFAETRHALTVMAEAEGELAGFAIVNLEGKIGYIITLDVAPAWRRHGLGQRLMEEIERKVIAAGGSAMELHVFTGNTAAVRLYERLGYEQLGIAAGFYAPGLDGFVYNKQLTALA